MVSTGEYLVFCVCVCDSNTIWSLKFCVGLFMRIAKQFDFSYLSQMIPFSCDQIGLEHQQTHIGRAIQQKSLSKCKTSFQQSLSRKPPNSHVTDLELCSQHRLMVETSFFIYSLCLSHHASPSIHLPLFVSTLCPCNLSTLKKENKI